MTNKEKPAFYYPPEAELLVCCSHPAPDDRVFARIHELCAAGLDWDYVLDLSIDHCVLPLLNETLFRLGYPYVPETVVIELRQIVVDIAVTNLERVAELFRILDLFEALGIECIVIKGPALAMAAYGTIALRPFGDLDLLVRAQDVDSAARVLRENGYTQAEELTRWKKRLLYHIPFRSETDDVVELHWELSPRFFSFRPDMDLLWRRSCHQEINSQFIRILSKEDQLLYLCVHTAKHYFSSLEPFITIFKMINKNNLDWAYINKIVSKVGIRKNLAINISVVYLIFEIISKNIMVDNYVSIDHSNIAEYIRDNIFIGQEKAMSGNIKRVRSLSKFNHWIYYQLGPIPYLSGNGRTLRGNLNHPIVNICKKIIGVF